MIPPNNPSTIEVVTLGGGCFWCVEAVFEMLKGVCKVESGYAGGQWTTHPMSKFAPEAPDRPRWSRSRSTTA